MSSSAGHQPTPGRSAWHHQLVWRLLLALGTVAILLAVWLLLVVAPGTGIALSSFSQATLQESTQTMRQVSGEQIRQSSTVLIDLIGHTATAREHALQDLPLEALAGDVDAIRTAILREDAERSARQRRNVELLATEMRRRADRYMHDRIEQLRDVRATREAAFVEDLSRTHLLLVVVALTTLLLVLAFGLHRFVVRPTMRLRATTQRIANGELSIDLPPPGRGEVGDLTRDFAAMIEQLRTSRRELRSLADNLEVEVQSKTRALETSHRQLAQAERLAALGTLAGGMAHEFHNVIGGIRGCADELRIDESDEDRRETLSVITRATERAAGIVQQLQRFAQKPSREHAEVDAIAVLNEALGLCEPAARRQKVAIEKQFFDACRLTADADGLHQVFVNLFVNALQAMPEGGTLWLTAQTSGPDVVITVRDSGTGIAESALPHVFDPFFTTRADANAPEQRGSGLGLSVSYGIVAEHGGQISVSSAPGEGAKFTVRLPRKSIS